MDVKWDADYSNLSDVMDFLQMEPLSLEHKSDDCDSVGNEGDDESSLSGNDEPRYNPNIKVTCVHTYVTRDIQLHAERRIEHERILKIHRERQQKGVLGACITA